MTVIYSAECVAHRKATRQSATLPLLTILFIVSYAILTLLVFEQGKTIESQRGLIREMLKDSTQLAAMKGKLAEDKASAQADQKSAAPGGPAAGAKPSDKATKRPGKPARSMKGVPGKPATGLEDVRRSTRTI